MSSRSAVVSRRAVRAAVAVAGALIASACATGPDWHRPGTPEPVSFSPPPEDPAPSQAVAQPLSSRWWDIFGDAELSSLESRVAARNLAVSEALLGLAQSRALRRATGAAQFPSAQANASYDRERASPEGVLGLLGTAGSQSAANVANGAPGLGPASLPGSTGSGAFDLWQYGFDASWELDLWGRVRRQVESAQASVQASTDATRDVLVSAYAETARDYLELRGVQAQTVISRQELDVAVHGLALARRRFAGGVGTTLDVANADAQVSAIRATLPALQHAESRLVNALSLLLGEPPRALAAELSAPRGIPAVPPQVPVGLSSELAERRPDIRAAQARLHAATADIGVAMADFYPRVALSASLDIQALEFSNLGAWNSRQYGIGPAFSVPLFDGGRLRGMLQLRQAQQKEAAVAYQRTVLQAWHEVDDALGAYDAAQNEAVQWRRAVDLDRIAMAAMERRYAQGVETFLGVLAVQNQMLRAQRALARSTTDIDIALTSLYKALGGGWEDVMPLAGSPARDTLASGAMSLVGSTSSKDSFQ